MTGLPTYHAARWDEPGSAAAAASTAAVTSSVVPSATWASTVPSAPTKRAGRATAAP